IAERRVHGAHHTAPCRVWSEHCSGVDHHTLDHWSYRPKCLNHRVFILVPRLRYPSIVTTAFTGSIRMEQAMNQKFRDTWFATVLFAAVAMLALTIAIVSAVDVLASDGASGTPAYVHYQRAEEALAAGDVVLAVRHWREGHAAAMASRRWEGLVEAGDLYRRIGARGGFHTDAVARARDCYLTALLRARGERSLDGVLR